LSVPPPTDSGPASPTPYQSPGSNAPGQPPWALMASSISYIRRIVSTRAFARSRTGHGPAASGTGLSRTGTAPDPSSGAVEQLRRKQPPCRLDIPIQVERQRPQAGLALLLLKSRARPSGADQCGRLAAHGLDVGGHCIMMTGCGLSTYPIPPSLARYRSKRWSSSHFPISGLSVTCL